MFLAKVKKELIKLKNKSWVDAKIWQDFSNFIESGKPLTKSEHNQEHLCAFFLPIHQKTQSIYLIDHIKGQDWMPPGGHIEPLESSEETVSREYQEELGRKISDEPIELFDLTIKPITNHPLHYCTKHYDFWYLVWVKELFNYSWDKGEFYHANWFPIETGLNKIKHNPDYKQTINKIAHEYFL